MVFKCKLSEFNNKNFISAQYALTFTPNHISMAMLPVFLLSLFPISFYSLVLAILTIV